MTRDPIIIQRSHDSFYLNENRYDEPKELFKFIMDRAVSNNVSFEEKSLCDYGCAAGEFLFYINKLFPKAKLSGFDILPELIEKCAIYVPSASLEVGSVLETNSERENSSDISFLVGVHSIFDEFEDCFKNLISWTKPGGKIYIAGMFNPFPVDVLVKYKMAQEYNENIYESGWNIFSQASVAEFLRKNSKVKSYSFEKFDLSIDLSRQEDPVRSWTIKDFNGSRLIVNALCIIQPHYLLEICL